MFYSHFSEGKSCVYCNLSLWYSCSFDLKKNPANHLKKCLSGQVPQKPLTKELIVGKCVSVHDQMLHTNAYKKIRLPLILTRLSGKKTMQRRLFIFQTYIPTVKIQA